MYVYIYIYIYIYIALLSYIYIYRFINFGTEISILQFDTIRVALLDKLYEMKINRLEDCQNIHELHFRILM
jgi:hypothetical protein